jgi:hypothetical protein
MYSIPTPYQYHGAAQNPFHLEDEWELRHSTENSV